MYACMCESTYVSICLSIYDLSTVYAIIFSRTDIFVILDYVCHDFSDFFITINRHKLKWKFSRGLTHDLRK